MILPRVQDSTNCARTCQQYKFLPTVIILLSAQSIYRQCQTLLLVIISSTVYQLSVSYLQNLYCNVKDKLEIYQEEIIHISYEFYVSRSRVSFIYKRIPRRHKSHISNPDNLYDFINPSPLLAIQFNSQLILLCHIQVRFRITCL